MPERLIILAVVYRGLAANNGDLENVSMAWSFSKPEKSTVHSCFSENYSDFYFNLKHSLYKKRSQNVTFVRLYTFLAQQKTSVYQFFGEKAFFFPFLISSWIPRALRGQGLSLECLWSVSEALMAFTAITKEPYTTHKPIFAIYVWNLK